MFNLENKVAIITGASRGIGKSIAEKISEAGAHAVCVSRNKDDLQKISKELESAGHSASSYACDVSSLDDFKQLTDDTISKHGKIDILINNAGIIQNALFQMTRQDDLKKIFEINFFSVSNFTQKILKGIIKSKKGSIVYISSTSGIDNNLGRNAYSSSKAATISQAQTLSKEVGRFNIRVNTIAPGLTNTDMMKDNTPEGILNDVISNLSLKRIGETEEIANVALFLSSDLSSYLTGQTLRVDGGM